MFRCVSQPAPAHYVIDPEFPRAPSQRIWDAMSPDERAQVVRELPSALPAHLLPPPPSDQHYDATMEGREALRAYFSRSTKSVYVSAEIAVYYPEELPFSPDVFAVLDVATHARDSWIVSHEGRGIDWILEVLVKGDRRKDVEQNVLRYARLGVKEYFIFEPRALRLSGYRLSAPGVYMYESIASVDGVLSSQVLGLDLLVQPNQRLRFRRGHDDLLIPQEIIDRLEARSEEATAVAQEVEILLEETENLLEEQRLRAERAEHNVTVERQRADEEHERANEEHQRADRAERELTELRASLANVRKDSTDKP
jgi:Uma2 family endonuclease